MCDGWRQRISPKEIVDFSAQETPPFGSSILVPLLTGEGARESKEILVLTSQEMKWRASDRAGTKKSMIPVLKHKYTHSHTDSLYKQRRRHLPGYWQASPGAVSSSQLFFRSSPPHGGDFITLVILLISNYPLSYRTILPALSLILFVWFLLVDLFRSVLFKIFASLFISSVLASNSLLFSHSLPPCLLQLNKQTNPLPLDTRLRRGDLLCLSDRILSDIVAPVNKRKAPEAREAALFVRRVDYLPHTPFCLFSLSGL